MKHPIVAAILLFVVAILFAGCQEERQEYIYSEGVRSGKIVKLSFKGEDPARKTYEGELIQENGQIWSFSIDPRQQELASKLSAFVGKNTVLELKYAQFKGKPYNPATAPTYATEYRITTFVVVDNNSPQPK